jgi:hypothetical protein
MKPKPGKQTNAYLKYTGLAFQLAGVVFAAIIAGQWLDKKWLLPKPYFTILFVVVFFSAFMYKLYLDLSSME